MKATSFLTTALALSLSAFAAQPTQLQFKNIPEGWTPHLITAGSAEAAFSSNSEAILNFHEEGEGPLATVQLHRLPLAKNTKLGNDATAWHKILFSRPATSKITIDPNHTYTYEVDGKWRYIIEFQMENGTMYNTIAMATVENGDLYVLTFGDSRSPFIKLVGSVRDLFKNINLITANDGKAKTVSNR